MDVGYVAISHIEVPEQGSAALEAAFRARLGAVDGWPGFQDIEVLADRRRPSHYVMISRWRSREDFLAYLRSDDHRRSQARIPGGAQRPRPAGFEEYEPVAR